VSEIKRVGGTPNAVIVQLPERQFPGIIIQYDSMHNLLGLVKEARDKMSANDWDEVRDLLNEIEQLIESYVEAFRK
jgi:hypothetical protein